MKKTMTVVVSVLVAGAAVGACCHAASTPVGEPRKQRKCPGKEGVQRPVAWVDDCDPDPVPAGPHTDQLVPSRQLLIASGHVSSSGWPLAYLYVDSSEKPGRESFSFISAAQTFTGNFSIGPANLAPIELATFLDGYCKTNNQNANKRVTVDADAKTCKTMRLWSLPKVPLIETTPLLVGNRTVTNDDPLGGPQTVVVGDWTISTPDGEVGSVHVQAGHEFWFVKSGSLLANAKLHTFAQVTFATPPPPSTATEQWEGFKRKVCPSDAALGSVYDVVPASRTCR